MHDTFTQTPMANTSCYWGQANPETWVFATIANVNKTRALVINSDGKVLGRPSLDMFAGGQTIECRPIPMTDENNRMFAEVFRRKSLANKLQAYVFDSLPIETLEAINTLIENNNQAMSCQSTVVVTPIDVESLEDEDGDENQEGSESDSEDDDLQDEDDWDGGLY